MSDETAPLAGRAATPPPPNTGQSTLGAVLGLAEEPRLQSRRWVHGLMTPGLRHLMDSRGIHVFPAVPGLVAESLGSVPARALVIEEDALGVGPWAGADDGSAPELVEQIVTAATWCAARDVPIHWVSRSDHDTVAQSEDSPLSRVLEAAVVIAPGSAMALGTPEGAPSSRLVTALRAHVDSQAGQQGIDPSAQLRQA